MRDLKIKPSMDTPKAKLNRIAVIDIRNGRVGKTAIFSQPVF